MIIVIIITVIIVIGFATYIGSGYTYQHNPDARKDLLEHM